MPKDMKIKAMPFKVKEMSENILTFSGSTETEDRDGDILKVEGWDLVNYKKNPVFVNSHRYSDLMTLGKATGVRKNVNSKELEFDIEFVPESIHPMGQTVKKLYQNGFLNAVSVGFVPKKWEIRTDAQGNTIRGRIFLEQELLELSAVVVPANPDALVNCFNKGLLNQKDYDNLAQDEYFKKDFAEQLKEVAEILAKIWEDEEGWTEIRYRIRNPDLFVDNSFRRIKLEGVNIFMIIGKLKSDPDGPTHGQALRFPKPEWTLAKAKEWVKDHPDVGKSIPKSEMVKCANCGRKFDYTKEPEVAMGAIKCPGCGVIIDQSGKVLTTNSPKTEIYLSLEADAVKTMIEAQTIALNAIKDMSDNIDKKLNLILGYLETIDSAISTSGEQPNEEAKEKRANYLKSLYELREILNKPNK